MGRPMVRTRTLNRDDVVRMKALFGTIRNAHRQLGLDGIIEYTGVFYRALMNMSIEPEPYETIMEAWERWKYVYLRPEVPASSMYDLDDDNRFVDPEWLETKVIEFDDRHRLTQLGQPVISTAKTSPPPVEFHSAAEAVAGKAVRRPRKRL